MKLHLGRIYWEEITDVEPLKTDFKIKEENTDVLIVGGGISGAISAYRLSKEGYKVTLIEKNTIGSGSTAANTGLIQYMSDDGVKEFTKQIGEEKAVRFYNQSKKGVDTLRKINEEVDEILNVETFKVTDSLILATEEEKIEEVKEEAKKQIEEGYRVRYLNKEELKEENIDAYAGLLAKPDINLNPYGFVYRILKHAIDNFGLSVIENAEFVDFKNKEDLVEGVIYIDNREIRKDFSKIILATGYYPPKFIKDKLEKVEIYKTYVVVTEKSEELKEEGKYLVWEVKDPYTYFKKTFENRLMIGGMDVLDDKITESDIHKHDDDLIKGTKEMIKDAPNLKAEFSYSALFGESKDGIPYMGIDPENDKIFVICGVGGNGTVYSTIASEMALKWLKGEDLEEYDIFKIDR